VLPLDYAIHAKRVVYLSVSQSKCYNDIGPVPSSVTISLYSSTSTQHLELQGNTIPARR